MQWNTIKLMFLFISLFSCAFSFSFSLLFDHFQYFPVGGFVAVVITVAAVDLFGPHNTQIEPEKSNHDYKFMG